VIRVAAVGDVHCGSDARDEVRSQFASVGEHADALLLAGDLTRLGTPEEAHALADALLPLAGMPIAAVLGNHDFHSDAQHEVTRIVEGAGVEVLEGRAVVWEVDGVRLGSPARRGSAAGSKARTPRRSASRR
jgi:predicted MPP superfamily phosphohydrolase